MKEDLCYIKPFNELRYPYRDHETCLIADLTLPVVRDEHILYADVGTYSMWSHAHAPVTS